MKKAAKSRPTSTSRLARITKKNANSPTVADPDRPAGKLGLIVDRLATKSGVTADELVKATGWKRNTVLGALSRLKARGFEFHLDAYSDRKAYRLSTGKG